ncbi:MAG TPA: oxidoreductase, partial [Firmicutes bacterium]|nr:oxidoreductase [Bacillota bacterium]
MKQLFVKKGKVEIIEVPAPVTEPGFVLIRTASSCISAGTELATVNSSGETVADKIRRRPELLKRGIDMLLTQGPGRTLDTIRGKLDSGTPTGYSLSGRVIEVGDGVGDILPGQRVAAAGALYANHAEIVSVPRNLVVRIPDKVSDDDASTVTLGAIAMQGVRRANPTLGESAAVIGLGIIGQITIQILKAAGINVIGFDLSQVRVDETKNLVCDAVFVSGEIDPVTEALKFSGGLGVDFAIITAATRSNEPLNQSLDMCRRKGRVVIVGDVGLAIDRNKLYPKELDVFISTSYGPGRYDPDYEEDGHDYPIGYVRWTENRNMEEYLRLMADGKIKVQPLINKVFPLERAAEAFDALSGDDRPLMVLLRYPESPARDPVGRTITHISEPVPRKEGVLNVGIIGAGNFATAVHLPNLLHMQDRYRIHTICDMHGPAAVQASTRFKAIKSTSNPDEIFADPDIDLVLISTRHDSHAQLAISAARSGKAVICEKPMGISRDEVLALVKVLKETETPYLVGFNRRFSPAIQIIGEHTTNRNFPLAIVYTVNAGYLPRDHWTHGKQGGGRIVGEACHMIDVCSSLAGSILINLVAMAIRPGDHMYFPHDNVQISLSYDDGSIAQITYTSMGSPDCPKERVEVHAGGWSYIVENFRKLHIYGPKPRTFEWKDSEKGHREELVAFSDWMRGQSPPPIELSSMLETTLATFTVYEQIRA